MKLEHIKKLEKEIRNLHAKFQSFELVANTFNLKISDVIHLLKDTEEGKLEYFKKRDCSDFPIFNFN